MAGRNSKSKIRESEGTTQLSLDEQASAVCRPADIGSIGSSTEVYGFMDEVDALDYRVRKGLQPALRLSNRANCVRRAEISAGRLIGFFLANEGLVDLIKAVSAARVFSELSNN